MRNKRLAAGFTLVEVVITIALVGILAAIAAPSIGRLVKRSQSKSLARGITNHLRVARNQAMSRGEVVIVRIDPVSASNRGLFNTYRTFNNAASCRSISVLDIDAGTAVATFDAQTIAEPFKLQSVAPATPTGFICFQPDGRVLRIGGAPMGLADPPYCTGEALVLWTAVDPVIGMDGDGCSTRTIEQAQQNYYWRVSVWENGQITMSDK